MNKRKLPPLNALVSFDMVAKTQHFAKAAEILCVSNSAVSQSIKHLEEILGVKLIDRTNKTVVLTELGRQYHQQIEPALGRIEMATNALSGNDSVVDISLLSTLSLKWFIPKMAELQPDEHELDVRISSNAYSIDFNRDHHDFAISVGNPSDWPDCETTKLMDHKMIVVGRPQFVGDASFFELLETDMPLLQVDNPLHEHDWENWFKEYERQIPKNKERQHVKATVQSLSALKNFPAIGLLSDRLIQEDLRRGSLVQLDPFELDPKNAYYIVRPKSRPLKPAAQRLIDWILENND